MLECCAQIQGFYSLAMATSIGPFVSVGRVSVSNCLDGVVATVLSSPVPALRRQRGVKHIDRGLPTWKRQKSQSKHSRRFLFARFVWTYRCMTCCSGGRSSRAMLLCYQTRHRCPNLSFLSIPSFCTIS